MAKYETDSLFRAEETTDSACSHIIRVAFEAGVDSEFDYLVADRLWPVEIGRRVEVPFGRGNKLQVGYCIKSDIEPGRSYAARRTGRKLKKVIRLIDKEPLLDAHLMALAEWISEYYVCPLGQVLAAMLPAAVKKGAGVQTRKYVYLAEDFEKQANSLRGGKQKQIIAVLRQRAAFNSGTAAGLQELLTQVQCTNAPVKKLAEKQIIKMTEKTVLKSLPAMPQRFVLKTDKVVLNADQKKALTHINRQIASGQFGVTLLHGVTDSGKTELYIRAVQTTVEKGKGAIVLLPEIALTTQTVQRFSARLEKIAVMHSGLTAAQRNVQWQKIKTEQANVVIGARSAVFAPVKNLGLVVVDEEHESSYKQDTTPRYSGRDVAVKRAQLAAAHCILGSATPCLETLHNCRVKKHFNLLRLPKRVMDLPMPTMKLIDMRYALSGQRGVNLISPQLAEHLTSVLNKGQQAILLLNRRGYSSFVFCPGCRHTLHCRNCDATLTFHKARLPGRSDTATATESVTGKHISYGYAICHYCLAKTLVPQKCPVCGKKMVMIGLGSQRLEEELARRFPTARIVRVDSDSMQAKDYYQVLEDFAQGRINILAGTQILAKGLHFPNVTLVGIINVDTSLTLPDFRANERTFQLISQVAGRAGRSAKSGCVFIQTFLPDSKAIQFALNYDYNGFVEEELKHRRNCNLPPYWRLALIEMRHTKFDRLKTACDIMRERIDFIIERDQLEITVHGPMEPAISRIRRQHRLRIIIQAPTARSIQRLFATLRRGSTPLSGIKMIVDIDAINVM